MNTIDIVEKNLTYSDLGVMIEKEKFFNDINSFNHVKENLKRTLKVLYNNEYTRLTEGNFEFIENLKANNNVVENQEIQLIIDTFATRLNYIPELLQFKNFKKIYKDYIIKTCKNNWKTGYEKQWFLV